MSSDIVTSLLPLTYNFNRIVQFDQIVIDYLHTRKFPVLGRLTKWGLRAATAGVLVGVYQFNTNDIGEYQALHWIIPSTLSHPMRQRRH